MKSTTNVFLEGLRTDLHPLSTSQQQLTDALNATLITFNGNEMMLQNDMGNTLILDSATGNIMGLNPGFIPVGLKEHGGIMYIASVGKDENGNEIGEIGTIPSPIIRDFYKRKNVLTVNSNIPINSGLVLISNKIYPADKFMANLQMSFGSIKNGEFDYHGSDIIGIKHWKNSLLSDVEPGKPEYDPSDLILERQVMCHDDIPILKLLNINYPNGIAPTIGVECTHSDLDFLLSEVTEYGHFPAHAMRTYPLGINSLSQLVFVSLSNHTYEKVEFGGVQSMLFAELDSNSKYIFSFKIRVKTGARPYIYIDLKKNKTDADMQFNGENSVGYIEGFNLFNLELGKDYTILVEGYPFQKDPSAIRILDSVITQSSYFEFYIWDVELKAWDTSLYDTTFSPASFLSIYTPLISYNTDGTVDSVFVHGIDRPLLLFSTKGVYELSLYSCSQGLVVKADESLLTPLSFDLNGNTYLSNYWYVHHDVPNNIFPKDLLNATLNGGFKLYPSEYKPGYLSVRLNTESVGEFGMIKRKNDPIDTPITVQWSDDLGTTYYSYFSGFYYSTNSGLYIDKIGNVSVTNEYTGEKVNLYQYDDPLDRGNKIITRYFKHDGSFKDQNGDPILPEYTYSYGLNLKFLHTDSKLLSPWNTMYLSKGPQQLFQKRVSDTGEDSNVFLLTSVANISTYKETELESSSVGFDELPHPGLFCAEIGDENNYKNWFRLDLDYYDQYDNILGHFKCRFNPYLNDVFGTNTGVSDLEYSEFYTIGKSKTFNSAMQSIVYALDKQYISPAASLASADRVGNIALRIGCYDSNINPVITDHSTTLYRRPLDFSQTSSKKESYNYTTTSGESQKFKDAYNNYFSGWKNVKYIYGLNYLPNVYEGVTTSGEVKHVASVINLQDKPAKITLWGRSRPDLAILNTSPLDYNNANISVNYFVNADSGEELVFYGEAECENEIGTFLVSGESAFTNWYTKGWYQPKDSDFVIDNKPIGEYFNTVSVGALKDSFKITVNAGPHGLSIIPYQYTSGNFPGKRDHCVNYDKFVATYTPLFEIPKFELRLKPSVTINPTHKIATHITLKSEEGAYVSLFNGICYKSNFETDSFGIPYNYATIASSHNDGQQAPAVLSYLADTNTNNLDLEYRNDSIAIEELLDAGIYVFYILRATCTHFWTTVDTATLNILVGDEKFTTNAQLNEKSGGFTSYVALKDRSQENQNIFILNSGDHDTDWQKVEGTNTYYDEIGGTSIRLYTPYVIILPNQSTVKITMSADGESLRYLTYGIYRIEGVSKEDVLNIHKLLTPYSQDGVSSLYVWSHMNYMNQVRRLSLKLQKTVELYNYMQKYGVFFRSCYSFMDGGLARYPKGLTVSYKDKTLTLYNRIEAFSNPYNQDGENAYPEKTNFTHFHTGPYIPDNAYTMPVLIDNGVYILQGYVRDRGGVTRCYFIPEDPGTGVTPNVIQKI